MSERQCAELEIYSGANERPDYVISFPDGVADEQIAEFEEHHLAARKRRPLPQPVDLSWLTFEPTKPAWPVWRGVAVVGGIPVAFVAAVLVISWLVTR